VLAVQVLPGPLNLPINRPAGTVRQAQPFSPTGKPLDVTNVSRLRKAP
jgi:hypothetical protein